MRACFVCALALLGLVACPGLAQDVSKGTNQTEREVSKETGHDRTIRDSGVASPPDAADSGTISL
jgi:hypothetical protein